MEQLQTGALDQKDLVLWGGRPRSERELRHPLKRLHQLEHMMRHTLTLWNALNTASQVLGPDMPSSDVAKTTAQELRAALAKAQEHHTRVRNENTRSSDSKSTIDAAIETCEQL